MPQGLSMTRPGQRAKTDYPAGIVAGLIGAVIVAVLTLIAEGLLVIRLVAQMVIGDTPAGLALGLALFMGGCVALGVLFAVFHTFTTDSESLGLGIALGAAYGLLLWLLIFVGLAPLLSRAVLSIPVPVQLGTVIAFGIVLGFYPRLRA